MFLQDYMAKDRFLHILAHFYTLKLKSMAKCRLWVYNANKKVCGLWTPIRTTDSKNEVKFKKGVFLGHPTGHGPLVTTVDGEEED